MDNIFKKGEELYYNGDFKSSLELFKAIITDKKSTLIDKSDALNMIGILLQCDSNLCTSNEYENSLSCFKKAVKLNPKNLGALLNIIEGFGPSFGQHKDLESFELAYHELMKLKNELSDSDKEMLREKHSLYLNM